MRQFAQNTICVWKGEARAFSSTLSVLAELSFVRILLFKSGGTTKIEVSAGTGENQKSPFWRKGCFRKGVSKRLFTIFDSQELCSAENILILVFGCNVCSKVFFFNSVIVLVFVVLFTSFK